MEVLVSVKDQIHSIELIECNDGVGFVCGMFQRGILRMYFCDVGSSSVSVGQCFRC